MRVQRQYATVGLMTALAFAGVACALASRQHAQETKGAANRPPDVLIEKGRAAEPPPALAAERPPLGEQDAGLPRSFVSAAAQLERGLVKHAPFKAELIIETTRPLRDGTSIARRVTSLFYRDGEGRTRRDRMGEQTGPRASGGEKPRFSVINDAAAGITYILEHRNRAARLSPLTPSRGPDDEEPGRIDEGREESLGRREVEGFMAEGTRVTRTIPAVSLGGNQPIEIVAERWYAPELQAVVLIRLHDPRFGESVYRLTNIQPGEPEHRLFEVPGDYELKGVTDK